MAGGTNGDTSDGHHNYQHLLLRPPSLLERKETAASSLQQRI